MIQQYFILAACVAVGQLFHLLIKAHAMKKRAIAGNVTFNPIQDFIIKDIYQIASTFVGAAAVMLAFTELVGIYPKLQAVQRLLFLLLGYCGSSLILSAFSSAEKQMQKVIDEKTNQLDDILNEEIMYEWYLQFEDLNHRASIDGGPELSIDELVGLTGGTLYPAKREVVYNSLPGFEQVIGIAANGSTYIAGPIRRPK